MNKQNRIVECIYNTVSSLADRRAYEMNKTTLTIQNDYHAHHQSPSQLQTGVPRA